MDIKSYLVRNNWDLVHETIIPEKVAEYFDYNDLNLSKESLQTLSDFGNGIYKHQKLALKKSLNKENVCLSTSTASGKSLIFFINGIENIVSNPRSKIIAIYPLKALGTEQYKRWKNIFGKAGLDANVGRIDGGIPQNQRVDILNNSDVVIMTPDIIHAWLLSNLSTKSILNFLSNVVNIIIDEAHTYSGVFGSNSAFLFRRLHHIIKKLGGNPSYISASATIKNPEIHLRYLTGLDFEVINQENDTSPKKENRIILVNPPDKSDILTSFSELMNFIANKTEHQFISFVDSRKQTEYLASITSRQIDREEQEDLDADFDYFEKLKIFPYRSGYEETDRLRIQEKLSTGELKGVISTSALEMGIDIPFLTLGILLGIPNSATSFFQRIGRVGRHSNGEIIIINNGSIISETIFREPKRLLKIPLSESALYLENPRIQYIHTLCLAREGGEADNINNFLGIYSDKFETEVEFPENFLNLCESEKIGEISTEFQTMKAQAGEDPNHTYPLRDIDIQYKVEMRRGPIIRHLGSLTYNQLLREAYPGAVYYYQTQSFRVYRVNVFKHLVEVRNEKKYTTKPVFIPSLIFPNLSEGNIYESVRYGDLIIVECNLQIRDSIIGYKERRGPNELQIDYPLDPKKGSFFNQSRFTRNYFTTGVILNHPALNSDSVKNGLLSEILFEAFLMTIPFERQDVSFGSDKHRKERELFSEGSRFISIFDQTYGSLRLTSRLMDSDIISTVLETALKIAENEKRYELNKQTLEAIREINTSLSNNIQKMVIEEDIPSIPDDFEKILLPGSIGLNQKRQNEEFKVDAVFFSRDMNSLAYRGRHLSQQTIKFADCEITVPIKNIVEVPGESNIGYYNYVTGGIIESINKG
jgi:DEAD/DEAH box helicase domain-containing protein